MRARIPIGVLTAVLLAGCSGGAADDSAADDQQTSAPTSSSTSISASSASSASSMSSSATRSSGAPAPSSTAAAPASTTTSSRPAPEPSRTTTRPRRVKSETCYWYESSDTYRCTPAERRENMRALQRVQRQNGGVGRKECASGTLDPDFEAECRGAWNVYRRGPEGGGISDPTPTTTVPRSEMTCATGDLEYLEEHDCRIGPDGVWSDGSTYPE